MSTKEFKEILYKKLLDKLPIEYKLIKSKELFQFKTDNNINNIYVYPTNYNDYFSIDILFYYDNIQVNKILKKKYSSFNKLVNKGIIGGDCKKITEKIFKKNWELPYREIIHENTKSIDELCELIIYLYNKCIKQFFDLCNNDFVFVHQLLNESDINKTGLSLNYEDKVLKGLIVAELANISKEKITELADNYEKRIIREHLPYKKDFIEVRGNLGF